jgi:photosystem II stability/assembly factor-like uncharacterized protein
MGRRMPPVRKAIIISLVFLITAFYTFEGAAKIPYTGPGKILIISGDDQSGGAGTVLPEPLVVQVLDTSNRPLYMASVSFTVTAGGGKLTRSVKLDPQGKTAISVDTSSNGIASAELILGMSKVDNVVEVRSGEVGPVKFTALVQNTPPVLAPIGDKYVEEGTILKFPVSATDPDPGDTLTFSTSALPANATFDASTGFFTFKPDGNQAAVYSITFSVSDGYAADSETIAITVEDANQPPVLNPIANQTVDEMATLAFNISASDPDGDNLTFSATGMPSGSVLEHQQGSSQATFKWTPGPDEVILGGSKDFHVTFFVSDNQSGTDSQEVTITVINVNPPGDPDIRISPPSIDFGTVEVGSSRDGVFQIHNDGNYPLTISSIKSTDPDFGILGYSEIDSQLVNVTYSSTDDSFIVKTYPESDPRFSNPGSNGQSVIVAYSNTVPQLVTVSYPDVAPGNSLLITARFSPSSTGMKQASLVINSNDPDEPVTSLIVRGNATHTPNIRVSPTNLNFGEVEVGKSAGKNLEINNDGDALLRIYDIIPNDPQFTASSYTDVAAFSKITVTINFAPSSEGSKTAILAIVSNDPDQPVLPVPLQGIGVQNFIPDISVSPSALDFGDVQIGSSSDKVFQIQNDGNGELQISDVKSSNSQFLVISKPVQVQPGGAANVPLRFIPSASGKRTGVITVTSNDPDESNVLVYVQGMGVSSPVPDVRVVPTALDFGSVYVGSLLEKKFQLHNDGNALLQVSSITSSSNQFVIPQKSNVLPGSMVEITVRFTPTSAGTKAGTITITSNDPDEPTTPVSVQGIGVQTVPDIRVVPTALNFGSVNVGQSSDKKLQIHNDGNALLHVTSITSTSSMFMVLNSFSVPPGGMVEVTVRFAPTSAGVKTGTITITSDDPDEPTTPVSVQGIGIQTVPDIRVVPTALNFDSVNVGSSLEKKFQMHNDGNALLQVSSIASNSSQFVIPQKYNVQPGSMVEITVRFTPTSAGTKAGTITITSNDPDEPTTPVSVQGIGVQTVPDIRVVPTALNFGSVNVGQSSDKKLQIHNDGNAELHVTSITSTSSMFIVLNSFSVPPGGMVEVTVRFAPASAGVKTGNITIASDDPDEPNTSVSVQGIGVQTVPDIRVVPTALNFGNVYVGQSSNKKFQIHNDGNAVLQVSSIASDDGQFTILHKFNVPPGEMVEITVKFTPTSSGTKTGNITITSDDPDELTTLVSVQGKGIPILAPEIRVYPTSIDFGEVGVGQSLVKKFRIYNDGNALLQISSITSNNSQFVILDDPDVWPGAMAEIRVRFTPSWLGIKAGSITIASNDPDEPIVLVAIQGKGVSAYVPDISVSPSILDFGEVQVGVSLDKEFQIYNYGSATLVISSITSNNSRFVVLDDPNVPSSGMVDIPVRFTPSTLGTHTGTITITSNDPDEPVVAITVKGKGVQANPEIYLSSHTLSFGEVELGESLDESFKIYNLGSGLLQIYSMTSNSNEFDILDYYSNVAPGQNVEISVRFTPSLLGSRSAKITITTNDPDEQSVTVWLYGTGLYPSLPDVATWQAVQQYDITNDLYDVHFASDDEGWIVGSTGTIAHSVDGGKTWQRQYSSTSRTLKGIHFSDSNRGWAAGQYGTILRTTNGGSTWSYINSGVLDDLNAIQFVSSSKGWAVGENGTVLATSNGYNWNPESSGTSRDLNDVYFVSSYRGWAVGSYGTILRTTNGGQTWTPQQSGTSSALYGVYFVNYYKGWVVGSQGTILHTQDAGQTWTSQENGVPYNTFTDVTFLNSTEGWVAGSGGMILYTNDGGSTWLNVDSGVNRNLRAINFYDADNGWAVGSYGTILRYNTMEFPVITSVTVSGSPAGVNGVIKVVAKGQRQNQAKFSISGVVSNSSMQESPYGTYTGTYVVQGGVNVTNAQVTVVLKNSYGNTATDTSKTVTIDTVAAINWANVTPQVAKTGDTVTVTMSGESDSTAKFSIETVVTERSMTESQSVSGRYTGTYFVPQGVNAEDAKVTVKLTDDLGNVATKEAGHVTIDTTAQITSVSVTGSPASFGTPIIVVLTGEADGTAKFSIENVVSDVQMSENQDGIYTGSYTAPKGTSAKNARVTAQLKDSRGNVAVKEAAQKVTIDTESKINSVTVSGSPAKPGQKLTVTMYAEQYGTATFSIPGVAEDVSMPEVVYYRGKYVGTYTVGSDDPGVTNAILIVTLEDSVGNVGTDTSKRVTIDTALPEITSIKVTGSPARANGKIDVTMTGEEDGTASFSIAGVVSSVSMAEDPFRPGRYTGSYTANSYTNVTNAVLTVTLKDEVGNGSTNTTQRVTIDNSPPQINSVSVTGSPAKAYGKISVTMIGEADCLAYFSIAGVAGDVFMEEEIQGAYKGIYTVAANVNVNNAVLTATLEDAAGNVRTNTSKRVTIDTTIPEIASVSISGDPATVGETISVTAIGEAGAAAFFSIRGVAEETAMTESSYRPGRYTGRYTVEDDMNVTNAVLTVKLEDASGNVGTDSSKRVSIRPTWDVSRDGTIDVSDLTMIGVYFGKPATGGNGADVNRDGYINIQDLVLVCRHFGESAFTTSPGSEFEKVDPEQLPILRKLYESVQATDGDSSLKSEVSSLIARLIQLAMPQIAESRLMQNYPNPCNPETWIPYQLAEQGNVTIGIYSSSGQLVRTLDLGHKEVGSYASKDSAAHWDGTNEAGERVSSGLYFYVIKSGTFTATRKMIISR